MSENYKQAPRLIHRGKKFVNPNDRFWQLPQVLMSNIFNELNGKSGNQIKLMCLLIGTAGYGNFRNIIFKLLSYKIIPIIIPNIIYALTEGNLK